jgi:hypothetical protein
MYPEDTTKNYNICLPIDTAGASSHSSAISAAQTDADNAQSTAATALSTAQTAESTAETALNTASNKISNTATFAFETIDGVEKLVLKDGDKTIVIANKADIKGDKGDKGEDGASPCPGGFETLLTSEDANESLYTVYCKQSN